MSLDLKIKIAKASDCSQFTITEETGLYDPNTNQTGYGDPNPDVAEVTSAKIDVTYPGSSAPISIDVFPTLPNTNGTGFDITPTLLGLGSLPDGRYTFTYVINGTQVIGENSVPFSASVTCSIPNLCAAECCVAKAIAQIPALRCDCIANEHKIEQFLLADVLLFGAEKAACCGRTDEFDRINCDLMAICQETNCNC